MGHSASQLTPTGNYWSFAPAVRVAPVACCVEMASNYSAPSPASTDAGGGSTLGQALSQAQAQVLSQSQSSNASASPTSHPFEEAQQYDQQQQYDTSESRALSGQLPGCLPSQSQSQSQPQHFEIPQSTVAAAHHGLQALQAATAAATSVAGPVTAPAPPNPMGQQYTVAAAATSAIAHFAPARNGRPPTGTTLPPRQTRLRKACDMCSARKIKVWFAPRFAWPAQVIEYLEAGIAN